MATPFIGTVVVGTAVDLRGFAAGIGKLRSAASAINGPMDSASGSSRRLSGSLGAAAFGCRLFPTLLLLPSAGCPPSARR